MQHDDDEQEADQPRHGPLNQRNYASVIDQQIAQAEAAGMFKNLPGTGQPQALDDDRNTPFEDRLAYRALKGAGFSLPWVEQRRDIDEERLRVEAWLVHANNRWPHLNQAGQEQLRVEYTAKLQALRSSIIDYNLRVPPSIGQLRGVELVRELARLGA
ncbi:MAG: DUF1992 domain-containing protein [Roseiflexaceae bacterium]|nr:DUF1992 domain-containing protein [Roseiflexaceae bacterium]